MRSFALSSYFILRGVSKHCFVAAAHLPLSARVGFLVGAIIDLLIPLFKPNPYYP